MLPKAERITSHMIDHPQQLVFELAHRPALGVEDFLVSHSNQEAVALVDRWPDWPVGAAIISGPPGSGKSHLANVWRLKTNARIVAARDLSKGGVPQLAAFQSLIIEDVASLTDEQALFHILNLVREQRLAVLLTSNQPPGGLSVSLPDLRSRLKALPFASIAPPDDALLQFVLVKLFADRQLTVEPAVIAFIMVRMERSMQAARRVVAEIDQQALVLKRGATRAVAAAVIEKLGYTEKDS